MLKITINSMRPPHRLPPIAFQATAVRVVQKIATRESRSRRAVAYSANDQQAPRHRAALSHCRQSSRVDGVLRR
jgi:hypothetical protein